MLTLSRSHHHFVAAIADPESDGPRRRNSWWHNLFERQLSTLCPRRCECADFQDSNAHHPISPWTSFRLKCLQIASASSQARPWHQPSKRTSYRLARLPCDTAHHDQHTTTGPWLCRSTLSAFTTRICTSKSIRDASRTTQSRLASSWRAHEWHQATKRQGPSTSHSTQKYRPQLYTFHIHEPSSFCRQSGSFKG